MPTQLDESELHDLLDGACILGAGGGGPYTLGQQFLKDLEGRKVMLAAVDEVERAARAAISAGVGSPDAAAGGFPKDAPGCAWKALEGNLGSKLTHVLAAELGAANSLLPMLVATDCGIPIVDGAGAARAVPSLTMCTYATAGVPIGTACLANAVEEVSFTAPDPAIADTVMRGIVSSGAFTQDAGVALWAMTGDAVLDHTIPGTTRMAIKLGAALRAAVDDPVQAVCDALGGRVLIRGRITAVAEHTAGGFDTGIVEITAATDPVVTLRVATQNENLVAWRSDLPHPVALAPDLITYLRTDGQPLSNADLEMAAGHEVAVIGAPVDARMRDARMVAAFLPALRAAGYGGPYVPIEKLGG